MKKKSKKKKDFGLRKEYKESWGYIKEIKNFIFVVIGIFFVFALIGYFVPAPEVISEEIKKIAFHVLKNNYEAKRKIARYSDKFLTLQEIADALFEQIHH